MENKKITGTERYSRLRELIMGETKLRVPESFLLSPANTALFTTNDWMCECFRYSGRYLEIRDNTNDPIIKKIAEERSEAILRYTFALKNLI